MPTTKRIHSISFLAAMLLVLLLIAWIFQPFFNIFAATLIVAILVHPLYKFILQKINRPALASLMTVGLILLIVIIPIAFFGQLLYSEINSLYDRYKDGGIPLSQEQIIASIPEELRSALANVGNDVNGLISRTTNDLFSSVRAIVSNVAGFVFSFFMFIFILYYTLKDGHKLRKVFKDLSPLASGQEDLLIDKIVMAVNGVVKGQFLTALVQGVVATAGYIIFGLSEPVIWGMLTVVAALVPTVGTALVVIPAVVYLFVTGETASAIGLAIWGFAAVSMVDNFVGPKFVGRSTKLHPVLVLLSILGGLQFFGVLGFLIGPIIMAVFVAMVEIYRDEFKDYINAKK